MTDTTTELRSLVLAGRAIRLEPMTPDHAAGLLASGDPSCFRFHGMKPDEWSLQGFQKYVRDAIVQPDRICYALIDVGTGQTIGSSSYFEVRPAHRRLEIGYTWISTPLRRTAANPEMKLLMMRHAFETMRVNRVQLKCDARNIASRGAMEKFGAKFEGVLRKHAIMPDGFERDSCVYSVIAEEWGTVKQGLVRRLGYEP